MCQIMNNQISRFFLTFLCAHAVQINSLHNHDHLGHILLSVFCECPLIDIYAISLGMTNCELLTHSFVLRSHQALLSMLDSHHMDKIYVEDNYNRLVCCIACYTLALPRILMLFSKKSAMHMRRIFVSITYRKQIVWMTCVVQPRGNSSHILDALHILYIFSLMLFCLFFFCSSQKL